MVHIYGILHSLDSRKNMGKCVHGQLGFGLWRNKTPEDLGWWDFNCVWSTSDFEDKIQTRRTVWFYVYIILYYLSSSLCLYCIFLRPSQIMGALKTILVRFPRLVHVQMRVFLGLTLPLLVGWRSNKRGATALPSRWVKWSWDMDQQQRLLMFWPQSRPCQVSEGVTWLSNVAGAIV